MQNLHTLHSVRLPLHLPTAPQTPLFTATPEPQLHTVHRSDTSTLTVTSLPLPPSSAPSKNVPIYTAEPTTPTSLIALPDALLLTLRTGEIFTVRPASGAAVALGDVTDADPARSGVLAASFSPDGHILALVSPVSLTLLDATFTPLAELPLPKLASHAALSWRSDGEFLVLVFRSVDDNLVHGFVVDRACADVVTLDIDASLAQQLAIVVEWQPRVGGFIAIAGPGSGVTFFERNGQRHRRYDFNFVANGTPKLFRWSPDCNWFAIVTEESEEQGEGDAWRLGFFTHCNYRWYCKRRVILEHRALTVFWDEDELGIVTIITEHDVVRMNICSVSSIVAISEVTAIAAVTDGRCVELTDFSKAVVPPPLSHAVVTCNEDVTAMCAIRHGDGIAMLTASSSLEWAIFDQGPISNRVSPKPSELLYCTRGRRPLAPPDESASASFFRMPVMPSRTCAVVVGPAAPWRDREAGVPNDALFMYCLPMGVEDGWGEACRLLIDGRVTAIGHSSEEMSIVLTTSAGLLLRVVVDEFARRFVEVARVANISMRVVSVSEVRTGRGRALTLLHDKDGHLEVVELATSRRLSVSKECTSFCVHEGFLVFTTRSHLLYCVLIDTKSTLSSTINSSMIPSVIDTLDSAEDLPELREGHGATRPVDRGSVIITSLPGMTDIILQAPRGNLETISPRPVVFEVVDRLSKGEQYGKAFELCRRQRVDMNHVINADYEGFLQNVDKFVAQVGDTSRLSVFMTFLKGDTTRVNAVCMAIVRTLQKMENSLEFTTAILTGLIRSEPSDIVGALQQVALVREKNMDDGIVAVDFLFVLVKDEPKVYFEALGTYDLSLAAFVAESSQMDPGEYMRELHEFRSLDGNERLYAIDNKLQRYDKALRHLFACGEARYDECVKLCHENSIYETGIPLFSDRPDICRGLIDGYGRHLRDAGQYDDAAAAFLRIEDWKAASECYRMGSRWEMAVQAIGRCENLPEEEKHSMYTGIADELADAGRAIEAARIRVSITSDIEGALEVLSVAGEWDAAIEAMTAYELKCAGGEAMSNRNEVRAMLARNIVDGSESLLATLRENCGKLRERGNRLSTLREASQMLHESMSRKAGAPATEEETESDVFSATSASSFGSNLSDVTFTSKTSATSLYSTMSSHTGPLSNAKLEKQALRRQQRASKKRIREGHPNEQEYLVGYLRKLVPAHFVKERVEKTVRALVFIGRQDLASVVLDDMEALVQQALSQPDDVVDEDMKVGLRDRSWAAGLKALSVLQQVQLKANITK